MDDRLQEASRHRMACDTGERGQGTALRRPAGAPNDPGKVFVGNEQKGILPGAGDEIHPEPVRAGRVHVA